MRITLLVILLGALALTWWALQPGQEEPQPVAAGAGQVVDYFVEELALTTFDAGGTPLRRLEAARVTHYRGSGNTRLTRPRFTLFEGERELWHIVSEFGTLAEDRSRLELEGEVEIRRRGDSRHPPMHIETRDLLVKPGEEYAETAAPVKITSEDNWIRSVGMRAWLRPPGHIQFLSQTRAYYAAQ